MPKIPQYGRQVTEQQMPVLRMDQAIDAAGRLGRAQAEIGVAAAQTGNMFAKAAEKMQEDQIAVDVMDKANKMLTELNNKANDPQKGLFTRQRKAAEGVSGEYSAMADEIMTKYIGELSHPKAQVAFQRYVQPRLMAERNAAQDFERKQLLAYADETYKGTIDLSVQSAARPEMDEGGFIAQTDAIKKAVAVRYGGLNGPAAQAELAKALSKSHAGRLSMLLNTPGRLEEAAAWKEKYKGEIDGITLDAINKVVGDKERASLMRDTVMTLSTQYGENGEAAVSAFRQSAEYKRMPPDEQTRTENMLRSEAGTRRTNRLRIETDTKDSIIKAALSAQTPADALTLLEENKSALGQHYATAQSVVLHNKGVSIINMDPEKVRSMYSDISAGKFKNPKELLLAYGDKVPYDLIEKVAQGVMALNKNKRSEYDKFSLSSAVADRVKKDNKALWEDPTAQATFWTNLTVELDKAERDNKGPLSDIQQMQVVDKLAGQMAVSSLGRFSTGAVPQGFMVPGSFYVDGLPVRGIYINDPMGGNRPALFGITEWDPKTGKGKVRRVDGKKLVGEDVEFGGK